jgi:hypothetical protein
MPGSTWKQKPAPTKGGSESAAKQPTNPFQVLLAGALLALAVLLLAAHFRRPPGAVAPPRWRGRSPGGGGGANLGGDL